MEQKYVMAAIDAALKAGENILSIYDDPASDFEIERKADNSPLTIADRKAHEAIVAILNDTPFPVLSEEGKHLDYEVRRKWDTLWIVDPCTTEYAPTYPLHYHRPTRKAEYSLHQGFPVEIQISYTPQQSH